MNFLQLCQKAQLDCAVSGTLSTVVGQTGSLNRIVSWVSQAWSELQVKHDDWIWMRSSNLLGGGVSFATVAGTAFYPLGTGAGKVGVLTDNFGKWALGSFRNFTTTATFLNEMFLDDIEFDEWRNSYMLGAMRNVQTRPVVIAVGPDQSLCLGPPPAAGYTITGDYYVAPTVMAADADVPTGLPASHHLILVYQAMIYYALDEAAPEILSRGQTGYKKLLSELEALRLPEIRSGGAL